MANSKSGELNETRAEAASREHREQMLDEALAESFPASDPPSIQVLAPNSKKARNPPTN